MNKFIWNPWYGCHKCSEGCSRCYVFESGRYTNKIQQARTGFRLPIQKVRSKDKNVITEKYELSYKIPSGSHIMVCTMSDFFIEEADVWRHEAWEFIHERNDCLFEIVTKIPERIEQSLPDNWINGWRNVIIDVTAENENRAYERIPILLDLPIRHMGIVIAPMLEQMNIRAYLSSGLIEHVYVGGESYKGWDGVARELNLVWVKDIQQQCIEYDTPFSFTNTGTRLKVDNNKIINVMKKDDEAGLAQFYGFNVEEAGGINWRITAKELEIQALEESAHMVYTKILESES